MRVGWWSRNPGSETSPLSTAGFPELTCPVHHAPLEMSSDWASCKDGHRYPIRLGIPRLLESDCSYVDAFGEQWKRFRTTQLDSHSQLPISKDRLHRCLGDKRVEKLRHGSRAEVLEAGCGAGRFTEVLLDLPSVALTSTDLSSAVEPNQENCPQSDRHRVLQCDIRAFPFAAQQYDGVVCLGVVQHTPDPEESLAALYAQVKPGGWLVIDHYTPTLSHYTKITWLLLRPIMKRLSPATSMAASEWLTKLLFPLHRAARNSWVRQVVLSRISPLVTHFHAFPDLPDDLQYEWAVLDTNDGLTDYYKHLRTAPQLSRFLAGLGARDIQVARGGNGVELSCWKPVQTQGIEGKAQ